MVRGAIILVATAVAAGATMHGAAAAGGAGVPATSGLVPGEVSIAAGANPNLTPLLFAVDPTESVQVYAKAQAFTAENASTCGGATGATSGGCCPLTPSDGACDDHDPTAMGCANANSYTVTQSNILDGSGNVIGLIETRFSPTCQTNWGRITGYGAYAGAIKQTTVCRGTQGQYPDSGCSDTDTGNESTRFSDQLYAPTECASATGTLILAGTTGAPTEFSATTPAAC